MPKSSPEWNKALVLEAFDTLFNKRDYAAAERFWSPKYIQHSAHIPPGRDGLFNLVRTAPETMRYENQFIVAEGDCVIAYGRFTGMGRPAAWIAADIIRFKDGLFEEHWDVLQDEATQAESVSGLGRAGRSEKELHDFMLAFYNRWLQILNIHVPVIAVLHGDCLGVAPIFACAADIALADETLQLQITFAGLGLYPGMALPTLLALKVGPYRASLLTMTNEIISGREAERMGLVERCVPTGTAYEQAVRTARAIAASAPSVVKLLKRNLGIKKTDIDAELEMNAQQQARDFQTDEYRSRVESYLPNYYG
jgi:enoyl-CoA hydratase/carnithine racemase